MKKILGGLALSVLLAAPVMAADMPVKAAPAPIITLYSWTGCYLGGHVGVAWARKHVRDLTPFAGAPDFSHDLDSFGVGGQVGCNIWQSDRFVLGIEAQATWIDMDNEVRNTGLSTAATSGFRTDADLIGSIAGRLGYAAGSNGQVLFFVKGGAAFARERFGAYLVPGALFTSDNDLRWGWMVGGGAEAVLWGNWTWKGEYNYSSFGTKDVSICNAQALCDTFSVKQHVHLLKFGINYKFFDWGRSVVARY
jgi:outer membrane immunogenic protein